jgi:hypothetical protein
MKLPHTIINTELIRLSGGLDVVTPRIIAGSGTCRAAQNVLQDAGGGYYTVSGYERYDGHVSPSDQPYSILEATGILPVALGATLTGEDSGATGVIIAVTSEYFVLAKVSGTFQTENVTVASVVVGVATGAPSAGSASTALLHAQYTHLSANIYRADIGVVPGSGAIRGIVNYMNVKYAFRDNALGTATAVYKNSPSGWAAVPLGKELAFTSGGTYEPQEGDVITGHTSGRTATLTRVVLESGTYGNGDAAGRFIFASQSGAFVSETVDIGAHLDVATIAGDSSDITFAVPGGRFEFVISNFYGSASSERIYGCDGKNRGFEFDGVVLVPIRTGMPTDAPSHVASHCNQLIFSFFGSTQNSSPGNPYQWTAITGSTEIAMGEEITGYMPLQGDASTSAIAIYTRNSIGILYGFGVADWKLISYKKEAGAIAHTLQTIGDVLCLDDRGITTLSTTQKYGNFQDAIVSKRVHSWLTEKRSSVISSCVMRDESQYWLFFSDKYAIAATIDNGKIVGMMPVLFNDVVRCIDSRENLSGEEEIFFGGNAGYVYQMNKGTSFDGDDIDAFFYLAFNNSKSPNIIKRYRRATVEVDGTGYVEFSFGYDLEYGSKEAEQYPFFVSEASESLRSLWDDASWDVGLWDGVSLTPSYFSMDGSGTNISMKIRSTGAYYGRLKISGILMEYSPRRLRR